MSKLPKAEGLAPSANEMVLAIVQPAGTNLDNFRDRLREGIKKVHGHTEIINLTQLEDELDLSQSPLSSVKSELVQIEGGEVAHSEEYKKLSKKMHFGTLLRKHFGENIFSIYGLAIIKVRRQSPRDAKGGEFKHPYKSTVFVLDSLKHPGEVETLRKVYGNSFMLIGVSADKQKRERHLKSLKGMKPEEAAELISRDENEKGLNHGQKMTDVFEGADYFFEDTCSQREIDRFVELAFGNTKLTPTKSECFMHIAASTAARSGDLSRQVGAVLVSPGGEILAIGPNEVPKFGGGQYSSGEPLDARDLSIGHDPNHKRRNQILDELKDESEIARDMVKGLIDFHRTVHAEMEALVSCARKGISTVGSTLFTTTFCCHNCVKHLVCAGVSKVIFIESYPKSLALELHDDAIEESSSSDQKMVMSRYQGVGPRRYLDFFSLGLSEGIKVPRKGLGVDQDWKASLFEPKPRFPILKAVADEAEKGATSALLSTKALDKKSEGLLNDSLLKMPDVSEDAANEARLKKLDGIEKKPDYGT